MKHRTTLLGSVGWLSAGSVSTRFVGLASGIITARALGVAGRGQLALLLVVGMLAGAVLPLGIDLWTATSLGRGASFSAVRRLVAGHLLVVAVVLSSASVVVAAVSPIGTDLVVPTAILCLTATGSSLKLGILQGLNQMKRYSLASLSSTAVFAMTLVAFVLLDAVSVASFVIAAAVGQLATASWPVSDDRDPPAAPEPVSYRTAIGFGIPTAIGGVIAILLYRLDLFLVSWWGDIDATGLLSVALSYTEVVWVIPTAAAQAVVPLAARRDSTLDTPRVSRTVVALMFGCVAVVIASAAALLPLVFGTEYSGAVQAVPPLAFAAVGVGLWKLIGHDLIARGDSHTRLWSGAIGVVVMIVSGAALIPAFGVRGAALASLAAYLTSAGLVVGVWCRRSSVAPTALLLPRYADMAYLVRRIRHRNPRKDLVDNGS